MKIGFAFAFLATPVVEAADRARGAGVGMADASKRQQQLRVLQGETNGMSSGMSGGTSGGMSGKMSGSGSQSYPSEPVRSARKSISIGYAIYAFSFHNFPKQIPAQALTPFPFLYYKRVVPRT